MRIQFSIWIVIAGLLLPFSAFAQSDGGVFGCNAGQYGGSPGTTAAQGGVYVPVNDAAVTINTGILVYKECVLRGVVDAARIKMTTGVVRNGTAAFMTGRTRDVGGTAVKQPLFPVNFNQDELDESDRVVALDISNGTLDKLDPAFRDSIKRGVARGYYIATRQPANAFVCPYNDLQNALAGNPQSLWAALEAYQNPACAPVSAYQMASARVNYDASAAVSDMILKLNWSGGIYDIAAPNANGSMVTQTPGRFIAASEEQLLTSGFRQQESANDINQMVGALFGQMSATIIGGSGGLAALVAPGGTLDQIATDAGNTLDNNTSAGALGILNTLRGYEQRYNAALTTILNTISGAPGTLVDNERTCWNNIISRVCAAGTLQTSAAGVQTCTSIPGPCSTDSAGVQTCTPGIPLQIATSTIFSRLAIQEKSADFATSSIADKLRSSTVTLGIYDTLAANLAPSIPQATRLQAIATLNFYVASATTTNNAKAQQTEGAITSIKNTIANDITTIQGKWHGDSFDTNGSPVPFAIPWTDTPYPPTAPTDASVTAWCNYNNDLTVRKWINSHWKK